MTILDLINVHPFLKDRLVLKGGTALKECLRNPSSLGEGQASVFFSVKAFDSFMDFLLPGRL